jgi:hypothetical protein
MKLSDITEAVLAVVVVGGIVFIAIYQTIVGHPISVPELLTGFGGIVLGSYFRGRSTNGTISALTSALQQSTPSSTGTSTGATVNAGIPPANP